MYSQGVVSGGNGIFYFHNDINVSPLDSLVFINDDSIYFDADVEINIEGFLRIDAPEKIVFTANNQSTQYKGIRIDGSLDKNLSYNAYIKHLEMNYGGGIKFINAHGFIDASTFFYNTHPDFLKVIDIFNSNVHIQHCVFSHNANSAIGSPANDGNHVAKIEYCNIIDNGTSNNLTPQINLGPSGNDTLIIRNNRIEGYFSNTKVGGISIATLAGGNINALISGNEIIHNSYGINQYGNNINSLIENNSIVENSINSDIMSTGSGIIVNCSQTSNNAVIRNNEITNNHWGIVNYNNAMIDLGTNEDFGWNQIYGNGNNGNFYNLNNMTPNNINAIGNWWGTTDEAEIEDGITHQPDDPSHGLVNYTPWLDLESIEYDQTSNDILLYPNPCKSVLNFDFKTPKQRIIQITNSIGQICFEKTCLEDYLIINTSTLSCGYYRVIITNNSEQIQIPLIIE
jgi:hypothetical protein